MKLDNCSAQGGGDGPQAVADVIQDILKLTWRDKAANICVYLLRSIPRSGDRIRWFLPGQVSRGERPNGGAPVKTIIYMVGCETSIRLFKDFLKAWAAGGPVDTSDNRWCPGRDIVRTVYVRDNAPVI